MNDLQHPCEDWAEPISLAAAGCLPPEEEQKLRGHVETCAACRGQLRQLRELCGALGNLRLPTGGAEAAIVERAMSAIALDEARRPTVLRRMREVFGRAPAGTARPKSLSRSLTSWRWIMRHPISRVAAMVIFVLALRGVALWLHSAGSTLAFADFIQPIVEAKSAKFKMSMKVEGQPPMTFEASFLAPDHFRQDLPGGLVNIADFQRGKIVGLDPNTKRATVLSCANMPKEKRPQNVFAVLRSQLLDAQEKPDFKRESLGEQEIDGRRTVEYRFTSPAQVITLWGDPKTGLPVRIETVMRLIPKVETTWTDFEFNVALDESLFRLESPAGYTVVDVPIDASLPIESDLVATLRQYAETTGGNLPDAIDTAATAQFVHKLVLKLDVKGKQQPDPKQQAELMQTVARLGRGFMFALQLPPVADAHYAGKGVKLCAADTPIFWYRLKDDKKYRVIYADLSVREADTPPSVPNAQPVPATTGPKQ